MESLTFEASMTVVAIAIEILSGSRNWRNVTLVQNHETSTSQNQVLETFVSMRIDAQCNEITPAISFNRVH